MDDLVVGFPQGEASCQILSQFFSIPREEKVTHIYRQPRPGGSLVIREIDYIGGFKAKTKLARASRL
jgi:hypothetical protein